MRDGLTILLRAIGHVSTDADAVSFLDSHLERTFLAGMCNKPLTDLEAFAYHCFIR